MTSTGLGSWPGLVAGLMAGPNGWGYLPCLVAGPYGCQGKGQEWPDRPQAAAQAPGVGAVLLICAACRCGRDCCLAVVYLTGQPVTNKLNNLHHENQNDNSANHHVQTETHVTVTDSHVTKATATDGTSHG